MKDSFFRDMPAHRRATIVCTIGPACDSFEMLKRLVEAGMDVARLNFSHGDNAQKKRLIRLIRRAEKQVGKPVAILQDLQGPKIRVGELQGGGPVELLNGAEVAITTCPCFGTAERFAVDYPELPSEVRPGDPVLLADGSIALEVLEAGATDVRCKVIHGGTLYPRKGVNLPGVKMSVPALTAKDIVDLQFGVEHGVDWVALSFVREADDIRALRSRISEFRGALERMPNSVPPKIIAKIEKPEAVEHLDSIVEEADGIMVARGDLGVELRLERVPVVQKEIIHLANKLGKPVITATQMLESMIHAPMPTRAETSDVANAIFDGTDGVMLSAETAAGAYPVEAVRMLERIARETEASPLFQPRRYAPSGEVADAIAASASELANDIDAACLVVFTHTGNTAIRVARFRPRMPILALCSNRDVCRQLMMYWNMKTRHVPVCKTRERLLRVAEQNVCATACAGPGDEYVLVAGSSKEPGRTDWLQARKVESLHIENCKL